MGAGTDDNPNPGGATPNDDPDNPNPQPGAGAGSEGDGDNAQLPEGVRRTIANLREKERELNRLKKDHTGVLDRLQKLEDATKTEEQRQKDELDRLKKSQAEWEADRKKWSIQSAVQNAVYASNAKPGYASLVIEQVMKHSLETDESGVPTQKSITAALKAVQADYADLFNPANPNPTPGNGTSQPNKQQTPPASTSPSGAATNPARPPAQGDGTFTRSQVADRDFWNANKDAIMKAYREGKIIDDTE